MQAGREEVLTRVEALVELDLTLCECGHSVGGVHNGNGCYHRAWIPGSPTVKCGCRKTDDQEHGALVSNALLAFVAEFREARP
jgi:hypothetical protein